MQILRNKDLTKLNTFGVAAFADYFASIESLEDLRDLLKTHEFIDNPRMFLGGGSNILFTKNFQGIVILNQIKGIKILEETETHVKIEAMSGEAWNDLVEFSVMRGLWGIENLSLIPGTVGGAPMQNIGAYGVELKSSLDSVRVVDLVTGEEKIFRGEDCKPGYRDSIFKNEAKEKYFILSVVLSLSKLANKNIEYRVLKQYLEENNISPDTSKIISEAVSNIRRSKLPDPKVIGNAGSFFKNVFIDQDKLEGLLKVYPEIPYFKEGDKIKIPSAWLIEHSGPTEGVSWKGYRMGNVGVHNKQALVLVNYGGGTGAELCGLANQIIQSVQGKFGITLTPEVNLV